MKQDFGPRQKIFFIIPQRTLGDGYSLSMTKGPNCEPSQVSKLVKEEISGATSRVTRTELVFNLPTNQGSKFPSLLGRLETRMSEFDVENIGIKVATMEDVFLRYKF